MFDQLRLGRRAAIAGQHPPFVPGRCATTGSAAAFVRWGRQVTLQVHLVVKDAADLNDPPVDDPIQEDMTSAPAVAGNMKRSKARHDLIARP